MRDRKETNDMTFRFAARIGLILLVFFLLTSCLLDGIKVNQGSVSGYVTLDDGASKKGVSIAAKSTDGKYTYSATSDSKGYFTITKMHAGTYDITFSKKDYADSSKKAVEVDSTGSVNLGTTKLYYTFGYIKGKITDEDGNAISEATVTVTGTNLSYSATTDASGNYSIKAKTGTYTKIAFQCSCWSAEKTLASKVNLTDKKTATIPDYKLTANHTFKVTDMKESTTTEAGFRKYKCSGCGLEKTEELPLVTSAKWAGVRVSEYGMVKDEDNPYAFDEFPGVSDMISFGEKMESCYEGSTGAYVLIVGTVSSSNWTCRLGFKLSKSIDHVSGTKGLDEYESYLTAMDNAGYSVWLQVEPGDADLVELATEVMNHYKSHSCVKGFGIDVEWHEPEGTDGHGTALTNETASAVLAAVKAIDEDYTVFVKHWDTEYLPDKADGLIFVNDSQGFKAKSGKAALERMCDEFSDWASYYAPCPVMFQIGYKADIGIWGDMENPAHDLGTALLESCDSGNDIGIIWVDFTLAEVIDKID